MAGFLGIVKLIALLQLVTIFVFVFIMYLVKIYFAASLRRKNRELHNISRDFLRHFDEKKPFSDRAVRKYRQCIQSVLRIVKEMEYTHAKLPYFPQFIEEISSRILIPVARKLYKSKKWMNRYYAIRAYECGFRQEDEKNLSSLIQDSALLISIHAAQIAIRYDNSVLINEMISNFSMGRHLQQSFFSQVLNLKDYDISHIVIERIKNETNPYAKLFCYRLLNKMACTKWIPEVEQDLHTEVIDLTIGVIFYISNGKDSKKEEILYKMAESETWEIRAAVAKALGKIDTERSIALLTKLLKDFEWWVRINSANSLYHLGPKGKTILEEQTPEKDRFAYETAQKVLITGK